MSHEGRTRRMLKEATIKPTDAQQMNNDDDWVILLMGPTGAGKSSFIEALAGNDSLGISKDQLDSFTKSITTYEMVDVKLWEGPGTSIQATTRRMYIIDTPGFADCEISELEIIGMVNDWLKTNNCVQIDDIIYLSPITDTRLSGSKRRTIEMLKLLAEIKTNTPGTLFVVTTMWDRIWTERGKIAAESRFKQLQDETWADVLDPNRAVTKFLNTTESAFEVINVAYSWASYPTPKENLYSAYSTTINGNGIHKQPFTAHLYQELLDRIQRNQQQKQNLEQQLAGSDVRANTELKSLLGTQLLKTDRLLTKFETQLIEFGDPPPEFDHVVPVRNAIIEKRGQSRKAGSKRSRLKAVLGRSIHVIKGGLMKQTLSVSTPSRKGDS